MDSIRLIPWLLMFVLSTLIFGVFLWFLAVFAEIVLLGGATPECAGSDGCSARGDVLYEFGEGLVVTVGWFLLSALPVWFLFRRFLPIGRSGPKSEQDARADSP
jgi:hypothetical protein